MLIEEWLDTGDVYFWLVPSVVYDDTTSNTSYWLVPGTYDEDGNPLQWVIDTVLFGNKV